jgi:hypothetical protein
MGPDKFVRHIITLLTWRVNVDAGEEEYATTKTRRHEAPRSTKDARQRMLRAKKTCQQWATNLDPGT